MLQTTTKYSQSLGLMSYAATQWIILVYFTKTGGLDGAGTFSLSQALTTPVFAFLSFGLRQWWVSGVMPRLTLTFFILFRLFTSVLAGVILLALIFLLPDAPPLPILILVFWIKVHESLSDGIYAKLDLSGRSGLAGMLLLFKSTVLAIVFLAGTVSVLKLALLFPLLVLFTFLIFAIELYTVWPLALGQVSLRKEFWSAESLPYLFLFTSLTSLLSSVQGYLPRYAIEVGSTRGELGYFALVSIPSSLAMMIATGLSQSHMLHFRDIVSTGSVLSRLKGGFEGVMPLFLVVLGLSLLAISLAYFLPHLRLFYLDSRGFFFVGALMLLSLPLLSAQVLSYLIAPMGKAGIRLTVNLVSLAGTLALMFPLISWHPILGAGISAAFGGCIQCAGFLLMLALVQMHHGAVMEEDRY